MMQRHIGRRTLFLLGLVMLLQVVRPVAFATTPASAFQRGHRVMLPLILHRAQPAAAPSGVEVFTHLVDGTPLAGVRVTGIYPRADGDADLLRRVTGVDGRVWLPRSDHGLVIEVEYPAKFLPCPDSPARRFVTPDTTNIEFVACWKG